MPTGMLLSEYVSNLTEIERTDRDDITLEIIIADPGSNRHGKTELMVVGQDADIPHRILIPENKDRSFKIRITLKEADFSHELGNFLETLAHEWELHGLQHAINIMKLKEGTVPSAYLGHGLLLVDQVTHLDRVIATLIKTAEHDAQLVDAIVESYSQDADNHKEFVRNDWKGGTAASFDKRIREMMHFWNETLLKMNNAGPELTEQQDYELKVKELIGAFNKYLNAAKSLDPSAAEIAFHMEEKLENVYGLLIYLFATPAPQYKNADGTPDVYSTSRNMLRNPYIDNVLLDFAGLMDAEPEPDYQLGTRRAALDKARK